MDPAQFKDLMDGINTFNTLIFIYGLALIIVLAIRRK